jgi:hypothetical protein
MEVKSPRTHCVGSWTGSRVDLGTVMKRIMLVTFGVLILVNLKIIVLWNVVP